MNAERIRIMHGVVLFAALYNLSGAIAFVTPGFLPLLGVAPPASPMWVWLPALLATFAAIVLLLSSRDLAKYAAFPYWNGIVRIAFAAVALAMDFGATTSLFITWLAVGDLLIGLVCVAGIPYAVGRSHGALLANA
jgi:hypothetical protein